MKYNNIREEELKNKVGVDWFKVFDTTEILGNIDFNFQLVKFYFKVAYNVLRLGVRLRNEADAKPLL